MNSADPVLHLHDVDLLLREASDPAAAARLRKLGLAMDRAPLERARQKALAGVEKRWLSHYERAHKRYGRAVARVRSRVCQGCHITLPTSASPPAEVSLTLCASCGRILYWR